MKAKTAKRAAKKVTKSTRKRGQPCKYKTAEDLEKTIQQYFLTGMRKKKVLVGTQNNRKIEEISVPTITGLVLFLGYSDRASFYDLEKLAQFKHVIKAARTRIEMEYEENLTTGNPTGSIFALKNFGWIDRQEVGVSGDVSVRVVKYGKGKDGSKTAK